MPHTFFHMYNSINTIRGDLTFKAIIIIIIYYYYQAIIDKYTNDIFKLNVNYLNYELC